MKQRYFIALIPDEPVYNEIGLIKLQCTEKYQTQTALRSPPHITLLPPFHYNEADEETLYEWLSDLCKEVCSFPVQLNGFGSFPNKVLFVDTIADQALIQLQQKVRQIFYKEDTSEPDHPFHPHMTIAFRDWEQQVFDKAVRDYSIQSYHASWQLKHISILKHDGSKWMEWKRVPFV